MFFYFKNTNGKDVLRLSTRHPMDKKTLDQYRFLGYEQVEHKEFVKLRKLIRAKGSFSVEPSPKDTPVVSGI